MLRHETDRMTFHCRSRSPPRPRPLICRSPGSGQTGANRSPTGRPGAEHHVSRPPVIIPERFSGFRALRRANLNVHPPVPPRHVRCSRSRDSAGRRRPAAGKRWTFQGTRRASCTVRIYARACKSQRKHCAAIQRARSPVESSERPYLSHSRCRRSIRRAKRTKYASCSTCQPTGHDRSLGASRVSGGRPYPLLGLVFREH